MYVYTALERMQLLFTARHLIASGQKVLLAVSACDDLLWLVAAKIHYANLLRLATACLCLADTRGTRRDPGFARDSAPP